ncbi:MAG: glycosyltransferase [Clostridium sp.]
MSKKICMFVWNHFTNDARVLRECTALAEVGYEVNLIALHDPNQKGLKMIEERDGFNIRRVKRYPIYLVLMSSLIKKIKVNKLLIVPLLAMMVALIYFIPIVSILIIGLVGLLTIKKVRTILIRLHIIFRMIYFGVKNNADIYHSNDLNTMPQGYLCSKILRRKRKLVYDSHEVQSSRTGYGEFEKAMEKYFIKKADVMIMTTHTRANYVKNLYKIEKPIVIHNYPFYTGDDSIENKYDLHKLLDIPRSQEILLYQGGIQQGRGLEQLVNAIEYMKHGVVVFIGDGKLKPTIKKMVEDKGLKDRVRFMDKVPVDELKYYTADAYLGFQVLNNVCFNHYSALSNKLFEYIMSEVPVVACDFPEIKRVVEGENIGICIDSHNPMEIGQAVNKLLDDKELHAKCMKNCITAREKFNWNNEKNNFTSIYNGLLSNEIVSVVDQGVGV